MNDRARRPSQVAQAISLILGTTVGFSTALAQQPQALEEVIVTGIRGSLTSSMELKRDSQGIVDGIVAEDIGKFPDTNLAESLQRISGVSIDRSIGEGSKVTVRGVGPDFNLVLLNGRQMPASTIADTSASNSRAFDFANLASESIAAVEVYKTGRADTPTGGIGATINIKTARPLDLPGLHSSLGVKGVYDTSAENLPDHLQGDSFTPEVSGIYSNTFGDDKFGIAISGSYQKRDLGYNQAAVGSGWRTMDNAGGWGQIPQPGQPGSENIINRPGPDDVYSVPQNIGYSFNSVERTRTNGQLALQWAPTDNVTATLDYAYSENKIATQRSDMSAWFNFGPSASSWTDGPVAAPEVYTEFIPFNDNPATPYAVEGASDMGFGGANFATKTENQMVGFNLGWDVTDSFSLQLDLHSSTAESGADSPYGSNNTLGATGFYRGTTTVDFTKDFPVLSIQFPAGYTGQNPALVMVGGSSFRNSYMKSEVDQGQLTGDFRFGEQSRLDFGVALTEVHNRSAFSNVQSETWGGVPGLSPADYPDEIWQRDSLRGYFDRISGSGDPNLLNEVLVWDFNTVRDIVDSARTGRRPDGGSWYEASPVFTTDRKVEEKSKSAYLQYSTGWEWGRPMHATVGVRYEKTDVTSSALVPIATELQWVGDNEFHVVEGAPGFTTLEGSYDYVLPSFDFSVDLTDTVKLRASYGESIGRPGWGDIQGGQTLNPLVRINGGTGNQGSPGLLPLESQNIDLSMEWYYAPSSYLSVGYFHKDIDNYVGITSIQDTPFNLPHPGQGAYAQEAVSSGGCVAGNLQCIRAYIIANHTGDPGVVMQPDGSVTIAGLPGDPIATFAIQVPSNQQSTTLDGWELNVQHVFGGSGFGVAANYTKVDSDIAYDNHALGDQFAIEGLSDSANLVLFYENFGWSVRAAYNWRDEFLAGRFDGNGEKNPVYTEAYGQIDLNVSYSITPALTVTAEGINVTGETQRLHGRAKNEALYVTQSGARYMLGARYNFGR